MMKTKIIDGFSKGIGYLEYRKQVSDLLAEGKSTGNEQTEDLLHYSKLNETRMNRLDKTILVVDDIAKKLNSLKEEYVWLVLAEGWCGDVAQIAPILNKMATISSKIELKLVFRDENEALMNMFLTNGSKSIPKVVIIEKESMMVKGSWGPRPEGAANLIRSYKAQYGVVDETAKTELQMWYLHDKGLSTMEELTNLMLHFEELHHQKA